MTPENTVPYLFLGSPPIGPVALKVLEQNHYQPTVVVSDTSLSTEALVELVEEQKIGLILVVGFGAILKQPLLDSVAGQVLNIHPSMLPLYRGPAPVVQTILDGVDRTGVTLIQIDSQVDHGPILAQEEHTLHGNETSDELYEVLTQKGTRLFLDNIDAYVKEELEELPQNDSEATFTHFVKKDDGLLSLADDPHLNERKVRAYQGWPGTWVIFREKRLIVHKAHVEDGSLRFDEVQPENGKKMTVTAFAAGLRISPLEFYRELIS